ncbi:MAG: hypothetical protein HKN24_09655 [Acidimicrobiales bacterium]|nr:hypothetical protein [Acidimicrobiales bacterium]
MTHIPLPSSSQHPAHPAQRVALARLAKAFGPISFVERDPVESGLVERNGTPGPVRHRPLRSAA